MVDEVMWRDRKAGQKCLKQLLKGTVELKSSEEKWGGDLGGDKLDIGGTFSPKGIRCF